MNRATSTYRVTVLGGLETLDRMLKRARAQGAVIATSGVTLGAVSVRFRCATDEALARDVARRIAGPLEFTLTTGYGIHEHEIKP